MHTNSITRLQNNTDGINETDMQTYKAHPAWC